MPEGESVQEVQISEDCPYGCGMKFTVSYTPGPTTSFEEAMANLYSIISQHLEFCPKINPRAGDEIILM